MSLVASWALLHISVEIPTVDARSCIRLKVVPTGPAQQAIIVEAVASDSSAADAGVQPGMKLTAISDPVRRNEVWQLQARAKSGRTGMTHLMRSAHDVHQEQC